MSENQDAGPLPPGWDRKYDHRTGRYYYINYFNKTTTWEDPRIRYRQLTQSSSQYAPTSSVPESIPMQQGSSDSRGYHVYPSNTSQYPPQPAFQSHPSVHFQDLRNIRPGYMPNRTLGPQLGTQINPYGSPARTTETTLTTDTEQSVAKISGMFPTVSDTHIRTLLMKYLKSVFPKAEETLLLDILSNSDNNVQKATEKLIAMGFEKRDTPPPRLTLRKKEEQQKSQTEPQAPIPTPPPRMKSLEEKQKMKTRLQEQYPEIPERVITIALDSVDFDEDRANQILTIMIKEEEKTKPSTVASTKENQIEETQVVSQQVAEQETTRGTSPIHKPPVRKVQEKTDKSQNRRSKGKKDVPKVSRGTSTTEDKEYKSPYLMKVCGPNRDLYNGPNDELLLADYITWNGPNADLLGNDRRVTLAKGPDKSLLQERSYKAKGPNIELRKGPRRGLAKGSIYSQLTNSSANESRGK